MRTSPKIPYVVLVPVVNAMMREAKSGSDKFFERHIELVRERCGPRYAGIPLDDIRHQIVAARKRNLTESRTSKGHGPPARKPLSEEYQQYMKSDRWRRFADALKRTYGNRCVVCYADGPLDIHHRTYERFGRERIEDHDCLPLCRKCHKMADKRRRIEWREDMHDLLDGHIPREDKDKEVACGSGSLFV